MLGYVTAVSEQKVELVSTSVAILDASCSKSRCSSNTEGLTEMNGKCCTLAAAPLMVFTLDVSPKVTILSGGARLLNNMQEKPWCMHSMPLDFRDWQSSHELKLLGKLRGCDR